MLDTSSKRKVVSSLVLSNFQYCAVVWHECGITNCRKFEKVHLRALKVIYNYSDISCKDLLCKIGADSSYLSRLKLSVAQVCQILKGCSPPIPANLLC